MFLDTHNFCESNMFQTENLFQTFKILLNHRLKTAIKSHPLKPAGLSEYFPQCSTPANSSDFQTPREDTR